MKRLLIILLVCLVSACAGLRGAQEPPAPALPTVFAVRDQVIDNLDLLYRRFGADDSSRVTNGEFILCMEGEVRGDTLYVHDFRMPHMTYSGPTSASSVPHSCDQYTDDPYPVLGFLHNHPQMPGDDWDNVCGLSMPDVNTWTYKEKYPFNFLLCDQRVWAWWARSQIKPRVFILWPPKGQIVEFPKEEKKS